MRYPIEKGCYTKKTVRQPFWMLLQIRQALFLRPSDVLRHLPGSDISS